MRNRLNRKYSKVLMYHEVTKNPERNLKVRRIDPSYSLLFTNFEKQMGILSKNQYTVVNLHEIANGHIISIKSASITFDDGLIGNYEFAFPILNEYKFPATFFVQVDKIDKKRHMSWTQLKELNRHGHLIQSHTMTHPMFGECDEQKIKYEMRKSKEIIEDKIGDKVQFISLPFGSYNHSIKKIAKETGYKAIFTSRVNELETNEIPYLFGRITVKDRYTPAKFESLINFEFKLYLKILAFDVSKIFFKKVIGSNNYRKIYRFAKKIETEK